MIAEFKKALRVIHHPGMSRTHTLPRLARNALPYWLSRDGRARPPRTLYWSINSVCNLHCKMCDVGTPNPDSNFYKNLRIEGRPVDIPIELFRSVIDEVAPFRSMISITSTEPLLYRSIGDAVAYARNRELEVAVTTGAYNLPARADELVEARLSRVTVSLDGPPKLHNEIRGRKDSFERAAEGIVRIKESAERAGNGVEVVVSFTTTNMNYHALVSFHDAVRELPVDRINFTYMSYVTQGMADEHNKIWGEKYTATVNCLNDATSPERVDVDVLASQMEAVVSRRDRRVQFLPHLSRDELRTFFLRPGEFLGAQRCMVNWFIAEIIANGDVIPYTRCYSIKLGNVHDTPFMEIWNGENMRAWRRELRKQGRFPACTRCDQVY